MFKTAVACMAAAFASVAQASDKGITLVENGKPKAEVVLPADFWDAEKFAAEEFVHYVRKSTGATLDIVNVGGETAGRAKVLIGRAAELGTIPPWN